MHPHAQIEVKITGTGLAMEGSYWSSEEVI